MILAIEDPVFGCLAYAKGFDWSWIASIFCAESERFRVATCKGSSGEYVRSGSYEGALDEFRLLK